METRVPSENFASVESILKRPHKNGIVKYNGRPLSYEELLEITDSVPYISKSDDKSKNIEIIDRYISEIILPLTNIYFLKDKGKWMHKSNKRLFSLVNQLQAIAYLTGHASAILNEPLIREWFKLPKLEWYVSNNFLNRKDPLKFINFDRSRLVLELTLRVLDPKQIKQRDEEVCGPTSFFQMFAENNPISYVEFVMGLAESGKHELQLQENSEGLLISSKNPELFARKSWTELDEDSIHDADFITLMVFRDNQNKLISYSENQDPFIKQLFGVTLSLEIEGWMKNSGFKNVYRKVLFTPNDIRECSRLLKYGYNITFLSTVPLAEHILREENIGEFERLTQLLRGHFFPLKNISYNEKKDEVTISIVTWGEESAEFTMPFKEFIKIRGFGKFIIGQSPQAIEQQRSLARSQSHGNRTSPFEYCSRVKSMIVSEYMQNGRFLSNAAGLSKILQYINDNLSIISEDSWTIVAKKIQARLFELYQWNCPR